MRILENTKILLDLHYFEMAPFYLDNICFENCFTFR